MNKHTSTLKEKLMSHKKLAAVVLAGALLTSTMSANAGWFGHSKHHGGEHGGEQMFQRFEKLGDMLDLSDEQMDKVHTILNKAKEDIKSHKGDRMKQRRAMMALNPDEADYLQKADKLAETQAAAMKQKMHKMALIYQQIHAVLSEEQKQKLERLKERKLKRMEKKWEDKKGS